MDRESGDDRYINESNEDIFLLVGGEELTF